MAYRRIETKFDQKQIVSEIYSRIMCDPAIGDDTVQKIADAMGRKRPTIYSYFHGQSAPPFLDFLHACVLATDGDPEIRKYLEPDGFELVFLAAVSPDKGTMFEECFDDHPELVAYHKVLTDPNSNPVDVERAYDSIIRELRENKVKWYLNRNGGAQ